MCGIIGFYKKTFADEDISFVKKTIDFLMTETEIRGSDTSGLFIKNIGEKSKHLYKRNIKSSHLLRHTSYNKVLNKALVTSNNPISIVGHCRMQTNGNYTIEDNNQPTIKENTVCVHNGIITNIDDLWLKNESFIKKYDIDTEIICDYFNHDVKKDLVYGELLEQVFEDIYGETTFGIMPETADDLIFATNTGSSYYLYDKKNEFMVLSSEKFILENYKKKFHDIAQNLDIIHISAGEAMVINELTGHLEHESMTGITSTMNICLNDYQLYVDSKLIERADRRELTKYREHERHLLHYDVEALENIKRCTKCLLPETFPFIEYDDEGVCNYCHNYEKIEYRPKEELKELFNEKQTSPDSKFLLTFSGGRDSCYGMHLLKKMDKNIISYSYDWGMITDLARRNQSRLAGALGVEHIIVSADLEMKRRNISKNVKAWLKRPTLGLIPLFMAGDKHYFYYANKVAKDNNLDDLTVLCDNPLEVTYFKFGFAGAKPNFVKKGQLFSISLLDNIKMLFFYAKEYILNPRLINSSIIDTLKAYLSYYGIKHNYVNLFKYFEWNEEEIEKVLLNEYNWELAPDTETSWRIGDGTAPFYNYIYTAVAGFSENDTFRSNQIREGVITREEGMKLILRDNKPRYESIKWYLDMIGVDFEEAIGIINEIPKLYKK